MEKSKNITASLKTIESVVGKVKAFVRKEDIKASAVGTNNNPTGKERLMHAIMATKEAYNNTTHGKRIPKMPTKAERRKIINHMIRTQAGATA